MSASAEYTSRVRAEDLSVDFFDPAGRLMTDAAVLEVLNGTLNAKNRCVACSFRCETEDEIKAHILVCEKHPLRHARALLSVCEEILEDGCLKLGRSDELRDAVANMKGGA